MIFETHAHYDDEKFKEDREQLVSSLPEQNIKRVINVGADFAGCVDSVALAEKYDYIYAAIGIHPSNIEDATEENLAWIKGKASWEKTVAIGEIGLDYYWDKEPTVQQAQREMFCRQLALAKEMSLPVIIHSRDAAEDTMNIMQQAHKDGIPVIISSGVFCNLYTGYKSLDDLLQLSSMKFPVQKRCQIHSQFKSNIHLVKLASIVSFLQIF